MTKISNKFKLKHNIQSVYILDKADKKNRALLKLKNHRNYFLFDIKYTKPIAYFENEINNFLRLKKLEKIINI